MWVTVLSLRSFYLFCFLYYALYTMILWDKGAGEIRLFFILLPSIRDLEFFLCVCIKFFFYFLNE